MDPSPVVPRRDLIADAALRARLVRLVRGKVPPGEVDDVVQATLTEALAAEEAPEDPALLGRWVLGIARHKCVDFYRRRHREVPVEGAGENEIAGEAAPASARDLLRWAEEELPEGEPAERTLEWMLREADGDKLEHIAEEERVPAPRVRQRVTRLRRHFRDRWAAQVAALVAAVTLLVAGFALFRLYRRVAPGPAPIAKEPPRPELERARELREEGLRRCDEGEWRPCLERLDEAARLDPAGNVGAELERARARAREALERPAPPAPSLPLDSRSPKPAPSASELEDLKQKGPDKGGPEWDPFDSNQTAPMEPTSRWDPSREPRPAPQNPRTKGEEGKMGNPLPDPPAPDAKDAPPRVPAKTKPAEAPVDLDELPPADSKKDDSYDGK